MKLCQGTQDCSSRCQTWTQLRSIRLTRLSSMSSRTGVKFLDFAKKSCTVDFPAHFVPMIAMNMLDAVSQRFYLSHQFKFDHTVAVRILIATIHILGN